MKRFQFTLAKLKEYREQTLDTEKNNLGILRRELIDLQTELEFLLNLIDIKNDELAEILWAGTNPVEITTRKRYITIKQHEVAQKRMEIENKEVQIEKQLKIVIEATRDVSTLEKLEEAQLEEYAAAEQKENELFIEEFVSNADFRKNHNYAAK